MNRKHPGSFKLPGCFFRVDRPSASTPSSPPAARPAPAPPAGRTGKPPLWAPASICGNCRCRNLPLSLPDRRDLPRGMRAVDQGQDARLAGAGADLRHRQAQGGGRGDVARGKSAGCARHALPELVGNFFVRPSGVSPPAGGCKLPRFSGTRSPRCGRRPRIRGRWSGFHHPAANLSERAMTFTP